MTKEIKIAVVAILGIVILYFGMNFLKGKSFFSTDRAYYIKFRNISGLAESNPIYANGYQVGVVKSINYDYEGNDGVVVAFDVDNHLRIPEGSSASIESDLMGNVRMNLLLADNPRRIEPGDTIVGELNAGLMGKLSALVPTIEQMLPKLDSILVSVNTLLADPAIARSLHNIQTTTDNLTTSTRELNTLMASLNRNVPGLVSKADGVLDNTNRLTANLAAVDIQKTMDEVNQTLANVKAVTEKINGKEGSLGLLMNDSRLYYDLTATVNSADSLLNNIKAHPKRYVHFSLFGRKDK
ncbi:MlaD family protein [Prevotella sp. KH2C16]|uniref:MlaD family protein n=1 Tax=Prevotella sp. KH2C16 TaxID=1855325 RepID=UPI0008E861D9|nr:MlaD family protein [Prevotella sp. KH2C16]SFG41432.1 phospholipid/cholesterol/gamma-HCH transport system substrate-binding protein [Prevotella sp. KH2C16]